MTRVAATRVVATPVETVWGVFADLASRLNWLSEVESVELLTPAKQPLSVGTAWRETRTDRAGHAVSEDLVIVAIDPGRSCTLGLVGNPSSRLSYVFTPVAVGPQRGGTAMQVVVESEPLPGRSTKRIANRLLSFVVGGFAARTAEGALRAELDGLAEACEQRATVGASTPYPPAA